MATGEVAVEPVPHRRHFDCVALTLWQDQCRRPFCAFCPCFRSRLPIWATDSAPNQHSPDGLSDDFVRRCAQANALMAKQLELVGRRYWIISEPYAHGWRATVVELVDPAQNTTEPVGIEATAQTRGAADEAAERKLLR